MNKVKELLFDVVNNRNFKYGIISDTLLRSKIWKEIKNIRIVKYIHKNYYSVIEIKNLKTDLSIIINNSSKNFTFYNVISLDKDHTKQNIKLINNVLSIFCGFRSVSIDLSDYNYLTVKYKVFGNIAFKSTLQITNLSFSLQV